MENQLLSYSILLIILFVTALSLILWRLAKKLSDDTKFKARVFAQLNNAIVITGDDEKIVYWNKAAENIYGYKSSEVYGKNYEELTGVQSISNGEQTQTQKNNKKIHVEISVGRLKDSNFVGNLYLIRDITSRKQKEDAQKFLVEADLKMLSSLEYETILKKLASLSVPTLADWCAVSLIQKGEPILISAVHKTIKHVDKIHILNNKYLLDRTAPFNIYKSLDTHKSQVLSQLPQSPVAKFKRDSRFYQELSELGIKSLMIVPIVTRGKSIGTIFFVLTDSGRYFDEYTLGLAEDLAHRAAIAVDNAELYLKAQEAIKTREEFLSLASHELKTPLTSLLLQIQMILRSLHDDPLAKLSIERLLNLLGNAEKQTKKLASLVANLLNVSRITGGRLNLKREEVDLRDIVRKVIEDYGEQLKNEDISIRLALNQHVVGFWDPLQIEQVITNLLSNALKYGQGKPIEIKLYKAHGNANLEVIDRGIGIEPEQKENIFKPFSRVAKSLEYQGLGVGLYIVRQIVEAHGGNVKVDSAPGKGSTFSVELPTKFK